MIRYAATSSDGARGRAETREQIDSWAAAKCAEGCEVEVWLKPYQRKSSGGRPCGAPERVGLWSPVEAR